MSLGSPFLYYWGQETALHGNSYSAVGFSTIRNLRRMSSI
jgi:hypothetical protein